MNLARPNSLLYFVSITDLRFFVLCTEIHLTLCPADVTKKWFTDFSPVQSSGQWSVWIYCGQQSDGGTTEDVYMVMYGLTGQTKPIHLNKTEKLSRGAVVKIDVGFNFEIDKV